MTRNWTSSDNYRNRTPQALSSQSVVFRADARCGTAATKRKRTLVIEEGLELVILEDPRQHDELEADNNAGRNRGSGELVACDCFERDRGVNLLTAASLTGIRISNERWVFVAGRVAA